MSPYKLTIISVYYSLTSLSTIGFGDLYPQTNFERIICSIMLLAGVSIFSYVLGEFQNVTASIQAMIDGKNVLDDLDNFFVMMKKFNNGQ